MVLAHDVKILMHDFSFYLEMRAFALCSVFCVDVHSHLQQQILDLLEACLIGNQMPFLEIGCWERGADKKIKTFLDN